jgi:hypothetical protein
MYQKNKTAIKDYIIDYTNWLGTDKIASASWSYPSGITAVSVTATTAMATVWLSGGVPGNVYTVENVIWTSAGRTEVQSFEIGIG